MCKLVYSTMSLVVRGSIEIGRRWSFAKPRNALPIFAGIGILALLAPSPLVAGLSTPSPPSGTQAVVDSLILHQRYDLAGPQAVSVLRHCYETYGIEDETTIDALGQMCHILAAIGDDMWLDLAPQLVALSKEIYGPGHPKTAAALSRYALLVSRKKSLAEGRPLLEEAMQIIEKRKDEDWETYVDILQSYGHYNRWAAGREAVDIKSEALAIRRTHLDSPHVDIAANLLWLGFTLFHKGDLDEGLKYAKEAEEQLQALGLDHLWQIGTIEGMRGEKLVLSGDFRSAEQSFLRCASLHERARGHYPPGFGALPKHGYNLLPYVQLKLDKPVEAWQALQQYREQTTSDYLALRRAQEENPKQHRMLQKLGRDYLRANASRSACNPTDRDIYWRYVIDEIEARLRIDAARLAYLQSHPFAAVTLEELQRRLKDDTAYVGWLSIPYGNFHLQSDGDHLMVSLAYVIRPDRPIQWVILKEARGDEPSLRATINEFRLTWSQLDDWGFRLAPDPRLHENAQLAGEMLLGPLLPYLHDVSELIVEYSGGALDVPLEALVADDGRYYGEHFAFTYTPCARVFLELTDGEVESRSGNYSVLAVGDPAFSIGETVAELPVYDRSEFRTTSEQLDELPRLPYSGKEVVDLAMHFPSASVLQGAHASKAKITALAQSKGTGGGGVDIIHFATHALVNPGAPAQSMLVFARENAATLTQYDGVLDAREITYSWNLDAELVTLSACRTASGRAWRGEPMGFMQAWFGAGARSLVANKWRADDEASYRIMTRFYENLSGQYADDRGHGAAVPLSKTQALQEARIYLMNYRDDDGAQPFAHPLYWAGFTLIGNPR